MPSSDSDRSVDTDGTDELVTLSRDELRTLVREEAREVAREEARRTRSLGVGVLAALLGLVVLGQSAAVDGGLAVVLVGVAALLLAAAGVSVTSAFDGH